MLMYHERELVAGYVHRTLSREELYGASGCFAVSVDIYRAYGKQSGVVHLLQ